MASPASPREPGWRSQALCSLSLYMTAHTPQAFCLPLHAGALQAIRARKGKQSPRKKLKKLVFLHVLWKFIFAQRKLGVGKSMRVYTTLIHMCFVLA